MSGKGSGRRKENTALVEANWAAIFGKQAAADMVELVDMRPLNLAVAELGEYLAECKQEQNLARAITNTEQGDADNA